MARSCALGATRCTVDDTAHACRTPPTHCAHRPLADLTRPYPIGCRIDVKLPDAIRRPLIGGGFYRKGGGFYRKGGKIRVLSPTNAPRNAPSARRAGATSLRAGNAAFDHPIPTAISPNDRLFTGHRPCPWLSIAPQISFEYGADRRTGASSPCTFEESMPHTQRHAFRDGTARSARRGSFRALPHAAKETVTWITALAARPARVLAPVGVVGAPLHAPLAGPSNKPRR